MGELENRSARMDMIEAKVRVMLRTIGPSTIMPETFAVRKCLKCDPPPRMWRCHVCDWETPDKWRFNLHLDLNPKWCREWGERKARAWAAKV